MKTIRVIIVCYPDFLRGASIGLRCSLDALSHGASANLDRSDDSNMVGVEVIRGDIKYLICPTSHYYISSARNNAIQLWSGNKKKKQDIPDCDGVICIDHDHIFTPDQLDRLVMSGKDVVAAAYPYRVSNDPYGSCYVAGDFANETGLLLNRIPRSAVGMQRCGWVGGGFMYIAASVFSKIEYPWFRRGVVDNGDEADELGEDVGLCLQLAEAGIEVFCDCDNVVGHQK